MAKLYIEVYHQGERDFEQHQHWQDGDEYGELIERVADSAYYCDGLRTQTLAEAYFAISEGMTITEANEWLTERMDTDNLEVVESRFD